MKPIYIYALALIIFAGCSEAKEITPKPIEPPVITEPVKPVSVAQITDLALASECAKTAHDVQGKPPQGYMKGITLSYARAICNPGTDAYKVVSQPLGEAKKDALTHYGLTPKNADERVQMVYSMMVGSAARESSWRWCVGKDPGATNTSSETCETGLYQTSYNSRSANAVLPKLYAQFKGNKAGCFATEYKGKTVCSESNLKNWGTGEGVIFQELTKQCPGFASEYHAVMLRTQRTHYGPINTKKTSVKPACTAMFEKIRQLVIKSPDLCKSL